MFKMRSSIVFSLFITFGTFDVLAWSLITANKPTAGFCHSGMTIDNPRCPYFLSRNCSGIKNTSRLVWSLHESEKGRDGVAEETTTSQPIVDSLAAPLTIGASSVMAVSLFSVATTRAGLPPGPFGIVGALEGISYLIVVGWVIASSSVMSNNSNKNDTATSIADKFARLVLTAGGLVLISLIVQQGCVPNAKPILDYSDYLPVCQP